MQALIASTPTIRGSQSVYEGYEGFAQPFLKLGCSSNRNVAKRSDYCRAESESVFPAFKSAHKEQTNYP